MLTMFKRQERSLNALKKATKDIKERKNSDLEVDYLSEKIRMLEEKAQELERRPERDSNNAQPTSVLVLPPQGFRGRRKRRRNDDYSDSEEDEDYSDEYNQMDARLRYFLPPIHKSRKHNKPKVLYPTVLGDNMLLTRQGIIQR